MNTSHQLNSVWKNPIHFLASGFGSGLLPKIPGTWGTLVAIPIYLLLSPLSLPLYALILLIMFLVGIWLCDVTAKAWGLYDHPAIVWDEIVGYLLTMYAAPHGWVWIIMGFVLFRLFDIWKPWPISWMDRRITGGLGIMLDDVAAAFLSWIALHLIRHFLI